MKKLSYYDYFYLRRAPSVIKIRKICAKLSSRHGRLTDGRMVVLRFALASVYHIFILLLGSHVYHSSYLFFFASIFPFGICITFATGMCVVHIYFLQVNRTRVQEENLAKSTLTLHSTRTYIIL